MKNIITDFFFYLRGKSTIRICLAFALVFFVLMSAGCETPVEVDENGAEPTVAPDVTEERQPSVIADVEFSAENAAEFVTLGQYKGIEYDPVFAEVTDQDVEEWIELHLNQAAGILTDVTDRPVILGDVVIIDYEGLLDGVPFPRGAAQGQELTIGSNMFIPGFEEQIIGRRAGEEFDIDVTFPENYGEPTLAGQAVVFVINLISIHSEVVPDLTDDFVRQYLGLSSVAEYKATIRDQLETSKQEEAVNRNKNQVWNEIQNNATVHIFPEAEVDFRIARAMMEFNYYAAMYDLDLEDLIFQISEMSLDDFIELEIKPGAVNDVRQDLILRAIAAAEGITITDEEFNVGVRRYVEEFDYESVEAFLTLNGENATRIALLADKVIEFVMSHAVRR